MRKQIVIVLIVSLILTLSACNSLDLFQLLGILNGSGADTWDGYLMLTQQAATAAYGATAWADQLLALTPVP